MARDPLQIVRLSGAAVLLALSACGETPPQVTAQSMSLDDFRKELINMALCGTPTSGPLAGKPMCTVHAADGTATLAGAGVIARFVWEPQGQSICRRDVREASAAQQCVTYERLSNGRYRNSDGVEFCLGPCQP